MRIHFVFITLFVTMSEELKNTIQAANEAELISYLKFKKTVLERSTLFITLAMLLFAQKEPY